MHVKLTYSKGTIIIQGDVSTPYGQFDPRINAYRTQGYHYRDVLKYLENSKIAYDDHVLDPPPAPPIEGEIQLYPYQQEAFENWLRNEKRGAAVIATAGGKCVAEGTLISTENGLERIEDCLKSKPRYAFSYNIETRRIEKRKILAYADLGVQNTLKIRTAYGLEIETTPEHPLLCLDKASGKINWKKALDLRRGDFIAIYQGTGYSPSKTPKLPKSKYPFNKFQSNLKETSLPHRVNRDFAKFLGYFLSKGSWNVGAVRFYSTDEAILKDYEQTVQHLFKLKTKCIPDKKNEKGITVAIYSRKLVAWLKEVVGSPNTSKKSHNITVPNCILSSSKPIVAEFLKAYFAGDGHINPERGVVEVGGGSEKIIREIQMLLLSHFGILSTFRSETSKIDGRKYTGYCLNLRSNSDIAKLVTQIGVFPNDKLKKALKMAKLRKTSKIEENGLLLVPIKKIYGSRSRVYDLTVEGTHSFIANGFVSHNTFIGLKAIETLKEPTIIIVPTLVLVDHWVERLKEKLNVDAGVIGGGKKEVKYVTVATYDSAYIYAEELGNKFSLMVLDEVHHALSPNFSLFLEMFVSPHRLGLTSTLHRPDLRHLDTPRLIGDVVYEATHEQLAGRYVSPFEYEKIFVDLTPEEKVVYEQQRKIYTDYLEKANLQLRTYEDFRRLIMRSGFDPEARAAVLARNLAFKIALNSVAKINFLAEQLKQVKEKTLIFTLHNDTVYQISKRFLVPAITHQTPEKERREILQKFKSGEYIAIVTSQVLDEGVDIPDASLGIILGGTGSPREYIQRLGRLLRKQEGKVAHLIEVVSRATSETGMSLRRHRRLQDAAE